MKIFQCSCRVLDQEILYNSMDCIFKIVTQLQIKIVIILPSLRIGEMYFRNYLIEEVTRM